VASELSRPGAPRGIWSLRALGTSSASPDEPGPHDAVAICHVVGKWTERVKLFDELADPGEQLDNALTLTRPSNPHES
jgi:hypothetical protein